MNSPLLERVERCVRAVQFRELTTPHNPFLESGNEILRDRVEALQRRVWDLNSIADATAKAGAEDQLEAEVRKFEDWLRRLDD